MKTCYLLIISVLCIASTLHAQDENGKYAKLTYSNLGHFEPDATVYTLGADVNLRDKASVQGKVVAKLPIATKVTIEKELTDSFTLNGWKSPWYQVKMGTGATAKKGFIWGGFLTGCCFASQKDKTILFIAGVAKFNYENADMLIQLRALKNGVELAKIEFKTVGGYGYNIGGKSHGDIGLTGIQEALGIKMTYEACDYGQGEYLLFWDGKKFIYGTDGLSASSAEVFYSTVKILFPKEKGGKKDCIVVNTETGQFNEKKKAYDKPKIENVIFRWQNGKLSK
jgi:hypothetical protein